MNIITNSRQKLDTNKIEVYQKIVHDNLKEFNDRMQTSFEVNYNENPRCDYYERVDKNTPPYYGHYFDDYCGLTINWLIGLTFIPHRIDNLVVEGRFSKIILDKFLERNKIKKDEILIFEKLFKDYVPIAPFFTQEHLDQLKIQINNVVAIAKEY